MSAHLDTSELEAFATRLGVAAGQVRRAVQPTLSKAGLNVKDAYAAQARSSRHFRPLAHTVSYDILPDGMSVEIGPDRARGGGAGLAGFFYGWPRGGGGSGDLDGPLEQEARVLGRFAAEAIEGLL